MVIYNQIFFGAIAQLGERLRGTQEVGGSIPPSSTTILFLIVRDVFQYSQLSRMRH